MQDLRVGFVAIVRTTFDVELAVQIVDQARQVLTDAGFCLVGPDAPVTTIDETRFAIEQFAAEPPDLLVVLQATFADSTMLMALAQSVDAPLLLWAVPEALTGGRLRLNSLCGINLGGHALTRAGYRYGYIYAAPDDPAVTSQLDIYARAARARRILRHARIGRVGEHPAGFETCIVHADQLRQTFGVDVVQLDLREQIFAGARAVPTQVVQPVSERLTAQVAGLDQLDPVGVSGTLSTYVALRELAERQQIDGFAVRCWPEFFTELGCAACGSMSMLSDELTPCSCEADVNGTVTQLMLQSISDEPAFGSDIVSVDAEHDALVLWHCGLAPLSMADSETQPGTTIHSNRKLPLLMEFPLKPGTVTVARLSEAQNRFRLVLGTAEMLRAPKSFTGTSGVLRFNRGARAVLDTILSEGLEHHLAITYGDHTAALRVLAKMLDLPVLEL